MQPARPSRPVDELLEHDAFVRSLARHLIRNAAGAEDLAQETWVVALEHPRRYPGPVRAWLTAIARSLAWKRRRSDERRARRESAVVPPDPVPSASEILAREEQRRRLVERVLALEEPARSTMLLRYFRQLPPRAIAKHFGIPVETVRTRIKRAHERLRAELDRDHGGDRGAWLAALLPFAKGAPIGPVATVMAAATTAAATLGAGVVAMSMKAKIAAAVVVLSGLAATALVWHGGLGAGTDSRSHEVAAVERAPKPAESAATPNAPTTDAQRTADARDGASAPPPSAASAIATGSVLVRTRWHDARAPVAGIEVTLAGEHDVASALASVRRTGADGACRFESIRAGLASLTADLGGYASVEVKPGVETQAELWINPGSRLGGEVVDGAGAAVAGAIVSICDGRDSLPHEVARTDERGKFDVASVEMPRLVSARAARFAPSPWRYVNDDRRGGVRLRITLARAGGTLVGRVLGPNRKPIAEAVVQAGDEQRVAQVSTRGDMGAVALLLRTRTDADGRFELAGVMPGELPMAVRAAGFAPWRGTASVQAEGTTTLDVELGVGATLAGRVTRDDGDPAGGAFVRIGATQRFDASIARADADGDYRLEHLAAGPFDVVAADGQHGNARASFVASDGATLSWDAELKPGPALRGRVLDADEHPVAGCSVRAFAFGGEPGDPTMLDTTTKQDGTFELLGCAERPYQVDVRGVGGSQGSPFAEPMATQSFQDVMPGGAELVVHISHAQPASAFVEGVVVDARGDPIADAAVFPFPRIQTGGHGIAAQTDEKGRFRAGPLAPGLYDVTVRAEGRVPFATTPFELHADEHRDLGTLHLARGGTLRAKLAGSGALDGVDVHVTARDRSARESCRIEGNVATATLAPGTWDLRTSGGGCAPAAASFEVREGEETAIEVTLTRANEVALVLVGLDALAAKQPRSTPYLLGRILDESGVALAERGLPAMADQRTEWRIALKPGAYRFEVVDGPGALASARFTVPDRATTEDLAIELR